MNRNREHSSTLCLIPPPSFSIGDEPGGDHSERAGSPPAPPPLRLQDRQINRQINRQTDRQASGYQTPVQEGWRGSWHTGMEWCWGRASGWFYGVLSFLLSTEPLNKRKIISESIHNHHELVSISRSPSAAECGTILANWHVSVW